MHSSKDIFISHSSKDKKIADKLVDLIETGIGVSSDNIFCSSLEGMGIPSGKNFINFIKEQITEPKIVILLLTQAYYKSIFCLCELGASWALSHNIIPIILKPIEYKDVKDVLTGIQVIRIHEKSDLNQMQDDIISILKIKDIAKPVARWEIKRDSFIDSITEEMGKMIKEDIITPEKFKKLKNDYQGAVEELKKIDKENTELKTLVDDLKKIKDKEEVEKILYDKLDNIKRFDVLIAECKKCFKVIPNIVYEALYKKYNQEMLRWGRSGYDDFNDSIKKAIDEDFLIDTGEGIEVNSEDPKISRTIIKLDALQKFVKEMEEDENFQEYYIGKYDHRLNFSSKRFWETNL